MGAVTFPLFCCHASKKWQFGGLSGDASDLCAPCNSYASYPSLMLLILGQVLCFLSKAYASYTILMYMSSYEYEICRPFSVPDNIIL